MQACRMERHTSMNWSIWVLLPSMKVSYPIVLAWICLPGAAVVCVLVFWRNRGRSKEAG